MKHLYYGKIEKSLLTELLSEVTDARNLLENFSPSQVIWNIEDLSKQPPWGDKISSDITSLANYFRTSDGVNDVFDALLKVIQMATDRNENFMRPLLQRVI